MIDSSSDVPRPRAEAPRDSAASGGSLRSRQLGPLGVAAVAGAASTLIGIYMYRYEGGAANQLYVGAATLLAAALAMLATRRPLVAAVLVTAMVGIIVKAGTVKHSYLEMNVHAYDAVFYLTSGPTLSFLWSEYRTALALLLAAAIAAAGVAAIAYRVDATRVPRRYSMTAIVVLALATSGGAHLKGERAHTQQFWDDLTLSTFYSSMADIAEALWRGQLVETASHVSAPAFAIPAACETVAKPPHIVLIHQESVVPPEIVPGVGYDTSLDTMFRSFDGRKHAMRVETYGGASWLTEFSVFTGLSTYSFGGMRAFVHSLMAEKIRDTVPQALARCGYRNVVFFPGDQNFVSYAKFYKATGFAEIVDSSDMKVSRLNERDRFYYDRAMEDMDRHFSTSDTPLFSFVLTMATHGPYDRVYSPEVDVAGGAPGTHPEMSEYLRRLAMARMDYDYLVAELERRFPEERFLIVHYGDHHPMATRAYLGFGHVDAPQDIPLARDSVGFETYFAVAGIGYEPPPLPAIATLDVPYLGTVLLEAAGLPLSDAFRERKRLMQVCEGRYHGCSDRGQILAFHRRLIDSGLLDAR